MARLAPFRKLRTAAALLGAVASLLLHGCRDRSGAEAFSWWDPAWSARMLVAVDLSAAGAELGGGIGPSTALVRLHSGNFDFRSARSDGADLRFLTEDDATVLPHRVERYDELLEEAFVWLKIPSIPPGGALRLHLYYGNPEPPRQADDESVFGEETSLALHFAETWSPQARPEGMPPRDSARDLPVSGVGLPVESALIGAGVRLNAIHSLEIPSAPELVWQQGGAATVSLWVSPESSEAAAPLLLRQAAGDRLVLGLDRGVPFLELASASGGGRVQGDEALAEGSWTHLAVVAEAGSVSLWAQGRLVGRVEGGLPRLGGPIRLAPSGEGGQFSGKLDELRLLGAAWTPDELFFAYLNQGADARSQRLVVLQPDETVAPAAPGPRKGNELFFVIVDTLNWDGWTIIAVLCAMGVVSWFVIGFKALRLRELEQANHDFIRLWNRVGRDLGELDGEERIAEVAGRHGLVVSPEGVRRSPLYHLYRTGWEQTEPRLSPGKDGAPKISALSIQSVRASIYATSTRESDRLHQNLVFLTFAISGAPFLGLLGTVLGVAVTFASIAAAGEVAVETIAPGVAAALATTIVGLCVAIPALFGYNYLVGPIKRMTTQLRVFTDEFVTRAAEAYSSRKTALSLQLDAPLPASHGNREATRPPRRPALPK
jgi:biopolymer transport protein ExbB